MYLFRLEDSQAINKAVEAIGKAHFDGVMTSRLFTNQCRGCFAGMKPQDMEATYWLGHADTERMGEYTASEFVQKFASEFARQFTQSSDKQYVKNLYLLGCETGLIEHGDALAQQIADELASKGFNNVIVHAIANPPLPDKSMIIKIFDVPSYGDKVTGEVQAMLLSKDEASRLSDLKVKIDELAVRLKTPQMRAAMNQLIQERTQIEGKALMFLDTLDIKAELDRPHNLFFPNHPESRPVKIIAQEIALLKIEKLLKRLAFSEACKNKAEQAVGALIRKVYKHQQTDIANLKALKEVVAHHVGDDWWCAVDSAKKLFGEQTDCYRVLCEISDEARQLSVPSAAVSGLFSPPATTSASRQVRRIFSFATEVLTGKPEMPAAMSEAIKLIGELVDQLENEYRQSWVSQGIKLYKANHLRDLVVRLETEFKMNPRNPNWLPIIESALQDSKLTRGRISHRTLDLLQEICRQNQHGERAALLPR